MELSTPELSYMLRLEEPALQLTIHIPDEVIEPYRDVLPPPEMGLLEAIMVEVVLSALQRMADARARQSPP